MRQLKGSGRTIDAGTGRIEQVREQQSARDAGAVLRSPLAGQLALRVYQDGRAAAMTLLGAAMLLGLIMMLHAVQGEGLAVTASKLDRWLAGSLPISALLVFFFSLGRGTPWFAGILATLLAFLVPGLPAWSRLVLVLVLSVALGVADLLTRRAVALREQP